MRRGAFDWLDFRFAREARRSSAAVVAMTFLLATTAQAGGLYVQEFSSNDMGTAGAGRTAVANDASTALHNPAGMTRLEGHQLWGGFTPGVGTTKFDQTDAPVNDNGGNGGEQQGKLIPLIGGGYAHKLTDRVSLGIAAFSISGASLDPSNNWTGQNQLTEISLLTFATNPGVAVKLTDWLSVAGNALIVYGRLDWKVQPPFLARQIHIEDADDVNAGGMASVLIEPSERFRFGVLYQSEVKLKLRGNIGGTNQGARSLGLNLDLPLPQTVRVSAYWDATEDIALMLSADWEDWSTADSVSFAINSTGTQVPLGFQDTWRVGFGIHYRLNPRWKLTTGYSYDSSALRNKDRIAALPIDEQHRLGFGAIHQLSESTRLGLLFEWLHLGEGRIRNNGLRGSYGPNEVFFFGATLNWMTPSWKETFGLGQS